MKLFTFCIIFTCLVLFLPESQVVAVTNTAAQNYQEQGVLVDFALRNVPSWFSAEQVDAKVIAWGDVDGDGDLDLAARDFLNETKVYLNENGNLLSSAIWTVKDSDYSYRSSLAWGDVDNDGDLDLATGISLYLNQGGVLETSASWVATQSLGNFAWGDVDGDGDFDLASGTALYLNQNGILDTKVSWLAADGGGQSVSWGDMDGDGDLDLAASDEISSLMIYLNNSGLLETTASWTASDGGGESLAWGDVDNDGDLDLAVGKLLSLRVYFNYGNSLETTASWVAANGSGSSLAWGDINADGALDLAVAAHDGHKVYLNQNKKLELNPTWYTTDDEIGEYVAWGDVDNDGDLDLAASSFDAPIKLYINEASTLRQVASWTDTNFEYGSLAWGDVDNDGDFDLAVGNDDDGPTNLYLNKSGILQIPQAWTSIDEEDTVATAWGDVDGDGDLDLAAAHYKVRLYLNENKMLETTPSWISSEEEYVLSIAWGDVDGDGDLDLIAGGGFGGSSKLYLNNNGVLHTEAIWESSDHDSTQSVALGDVDGDGDLDLAVGNNGQPSKLYLNNSGVLQSNSTWTSEPVESTQGVAWGDVDGDGDLDLATGNYRQPNRLYLNENGRLQSQPYWRSSDSDETTSIAWGDVDNDGDIDLVAGNRSQSKIYLNYQGKLQQTFSWATVDENYAAYVAWGDVNGDGKLDLAIKNQDDAKLYLNHLPTYYPYPGRQHQAPSVVLHLNSSPVSTFDQRWSTALAAANFYATPGIRQAPTIPITYTLFHPGSEPISAIRVYYSLDGSFSSDRSNWRIAKPTSNTQITGLSSSPYPTRTVTNTHVFHWDVLGSGFFGQSDNIVLRIEVLPSLKPMRNHVPGLYQHAQVSTQSFPFRVRGTQIRVVYDELTQTPVRQVNVYHLPADQTQLAMPFTANSGKFLSADQFGYLQGRGRLEPGDRLFALAPITATDKYTVYHTNGVVTPIGLEGYTVQAGGIQTITVSAANTLILYNLVVSLEWDARNDPTFMAQLENDLRRTSQILFDLTNGQAALGDVRIYHDKGFWGTADVVIAASNNQRPNAILGGSVLTPTADVDINGNAIPEAYVPGQVRMGATWNRFGNPNGTLGEDWPRTLAHELGHYLFFVPDNYIGVTPDRQFVQIVDCQGSVMTDPYEESYSEFLTDDGWQTAACQRSVAAVYLGRPDWATITRFYPMLNGRSGNPGPAQLPLAVTRIATFAPPRPTTTLAAPFFPLVNQQGQTISIPDGRGQAYLFKTGSNPDPTDDYLIALGTPIGDLVQARGAAPGDRLCVFDYAHQPLRLGCQAVIGNAPSPITLAEVADWSPQIQVRGVTTNTVIVTVTHVSADNLAIQLLPALGVASAEAPMTRQGDAFVQTVTAVDGAYFGFVRIWVPGSHPLKELVIEYSANESWDGRARAWGTSADAWGGRARAWGGRAYGWGGRARAWGAPVMSSDGQVSIFPLDNPFAGGAQYTLQSVAFPPALPSWLTAVGQAYRVASTGTLARSAILFSYLGRDVPDGYENFLTIYYSPDEGRSWQRLSTDLDTNRNQASAPVLGEGIYLLVATIQSDPALAAGWNTIGYPIQTTQPITQALASVAGNYSVVYHYRVAPTPAWQTFAPAVLPPFDTMVNDLKNLELGHAYWLYATAATNLYWGVGNGITASRASSPSNAPSAPATYYGWVMSGPAFLPTAGMRVTATIDGAVCGETTVQLFNGQPGYVLRVAANDPQDAATTCGEVGKVVTFTVGDRTTAQTSIWSNQAAQFFSMGPTGGLSAPPPQPHTLYLPLARK